MESKNQLEQNNSNKSSGVSCQNENEPIKYEVEKITFLVNPIHKKSGETISDILIKLMRQETQKS